MRKSAVEKAGAWKPSKTTNRFPPAPTLPWKSRRKREIPTFPPRRLRLLLCPKEKQRQNPKPRRRRPDGRVALFHKADRSRINKTGQLDLLTTSQFFPKEFSCESQGDQEILGDLTGVASKFDPTRRALHAHDRLAPQSAPPSQMH